MTQPTKKIHPKENRLWKFMSRNEEELFHKETIERLIQNPRYYLDKLDHLPEFKVRGGNYAPKKRKVYK